MIKKKILVIGSNSFAGSIFIDHALKKNFIVVGISRSSENNDIFLPYKKNNNKKDYSFYKLDINKDFKEILELISGMEPEYIVDFAGQGMVAESWNFPEQWYQTNIVAKAKLHNFLLNKKYLKKYIRISTPEVYGSTKNRVTESTVYHPSTPYAVSHAAVDLSLIAFNKNRNFPVVIGRFANFYGPSQQLYRIIPRTIIYSKLSRKLTLHGGGISVRAFIFSDDVADAILKLIAVGKVGEIYHFSPDEYYKIRDVVKMIASKLDVDFNKLTSIGIDRIGKDSQYLMNSKKSKKYLNWECKMSLSDGIDKVINWVNENFEEIKKIELNYVHKK